MVRSISAAMTEASSIVTSIDTARTLATRPAGPEKCIRCRSFSFFQRAKTLQWWLSSQRQQRWSQK